MKQKKILPTVVGIALASIFKVASAEFIVIQDSVAKDPPPNNYRVINQESTNNSGQGDLSADHMQLITDVERLRAENMALRNQLYQRELHGQSSATQIRSQRANTYRALSKGRFNISNKNLAALVKQINRHSSTVTVIGYTDSTGTDAANRKVGLQRATAFSQLLTRNGVKKGKVKVLYRPADYVATNSTKAGRAENRRVEIQFN